MDERVKAAITRLLDFQFKERNFEQYNCRSCGAQRETTYDEGDVRIKDEEHSPNCPYRIVKEYLESLE